MFDPTKGEKQWKYLIETRINLRDKEYSPSPRALVLTLHWRHSLEKKDGEGGEMIEDILF